MQAGIAIVNTQDGPFADVRVRRAAFLAVNRWESVKALPTSTKPAGPVFPAGWGFSDEELFKLPGYRGGEGGEPKSLDRDEARALLTAAGYPDGVDVTLFTIASIPRHVQLSQFIADQLGTVGIRVDNRVVDRATWGEVWLETKDYDLVNIEGNVAYPDPDAVKRMLSPPWSRAENPELIALWNKQNLATDLGQRRQAALALETALIAEVNQIPINQYTDFWPMRPEVKGWTAPLGIWTRHRLDHVWLES
jgi:ABC-type transport system substrate-binding protein